MRLVTFSLDTPLGPQSRVGAVRGEDVVDVNLAYRELLRAERRTGRAAQVADVVVPADMLALIDGGPLAAEALAEAVAFAGRGTSGGAPLVHQLTGLRLHAPLPEPRGLREFGQFIGHASRGGRRTLADEWFEAPHYWKGNPHTIVGPGAELAWPDGLERLDFELEVACVIGRGGTDIPETDAMEHVLGFTIFNDVCARDLQVRELPAGKGPSKSHDFCSAMGPMLVSPDEFDPHDFTAHVHVNGDAWATATAADMHFRWPAVIAHASRYEGLVPGDVLVSGTLTGCSAIEHYEWADVGPLLRPGDELELEIEGLGVLRNSVAGPA